jgi:very-short-patch-repair endonuclease
MGNAVRWTEEQLREYRMRNEKPDMRGVDIDAVHKRPRMESKLELRFDQQIFEANLPKPEKNWFFMLGRDFELDRAWPALRVAVEIQGMAHRIKGKFKRDIEKRALAMLAGWTVLEVDGASIRDGRAIDWLKQLFKKNDGGTHEPSPGDRLRHQEADLPHQPNKAHLPVRRRSSPDGRGEGTPCAEG